MRAAAKRVLSPWVLVALFLVATAACDKCGDKPTGAPDAGASAPDAVASVVPSATVTATAPSATAVVDGASSAVAAPMGDGGGPCPVLAGPIQLPHTGSAAITPNGDGVDVVFLVGGAPKVIHQATPKTEPAAAKEVPITGATASTDPGCAAAGTVAFCMDRDGTIQRTPLAGGAATQVGKAKPGTRLAASSLGGETVVAFLAERKTSEGVTTEAWIVGTSTPLTRISDDGAGATFVTLAPTGPDKMVALYIDGRRGMAPIHGVGLSLRGGKIERDKDDVLFVAGGAETYTAGAVATSADGRALALVPIAHDVGFGLLVTRFGVASDEHWSDYANGLDPAPIAATTLATGDPWALRVKPAEARFGAPRVLELGRVTNAGFVATGVVPTHGSARDVAMTTDPGGALAVVFTDASGTWFERLRCQ